jgi:hypothetical protein
LAEFFVKTLKTAFLSLLLAILVSSVPTTSGATEGRYCPVQGKDVDTGGAGARDGADAVLLRANQLSVRAIGGARTPVVLRGLLCEACLLPFAARGQDILREARPAAARSPVAIIHFPRPPPSVSL